MVFSITNLTHMQIVHGGIVPVVRQHGLDGIPGPAVQAGSECITESPVGWIFDLFPARIANGNVGREKKIGLSISYGVNDTEPRILLLFDLLDRMVSDYSVNRRILNKMLVKNFCFFFISIDSNVNAIVGVTHTTAQLHVFCDPAYIWPESNALYNSFDMYVKSLHGYASCGTNTFDLSQLYQLSSPSPLVQLSSLNSNFGLIFLAFSFTLSILNGT
jgi:hypothetical protein